MMCFFSPLRWVTKVLHPSAAAPAPLSNVGSYCGSSRLSYSVSALSRDERSGLYLCLMRNKKQVYALERLHFVMSQRETLTGVLLWTIMEKSVCGQQVMLRMLLWTVGKSCCTTVTWLSPRHSYDDSPTKFSRLTPHRKARALSPALLTPIPDALQRRERGLSRSRRRQTITAIWKINFQ